MPKRMTAEVAREEALIAAILLADELAHLPLSHVVLTGVSGWQARLRKDQDWFAAILACREFVGAADLLIFEAATQHANVAEAQRMLRELRETLAQIR